MPNISLIIPTIELKEEYIDFFKDWKASNEAIVPWIIEKNPTEFEEMLDFLFKNEDEKYIPEGRVPSSTFWLVIDHRKVVGAVNIRHVLNEKLFQCGGHIGYGIRPSERQKGYATKLLSLALKKSKELGIKDALVACDDHNHASKKTILKNGGVQDKDFVEQDGNVVNRFWIKVE